MKKIGLFMIALSSVLILLTGCSKPDVTGKWQLFYFGESTDCKEKAVLYYSEGIDKNAYMELKAGGSASWYSPYDLHPDTGTWKREGAFIWIEKNMSDASYFQKHWNKMIHSELIYSLSNDRMVTYHPLSAEGRYYFCWQKIR